MMSNIPDRLSLEFLSRNNETCFNPIYAGSPNAKLYRVALNQRVAKKSGTGGHLGIKLCTHVH